MMKRAAAYAGDAVVAIVVAVVLLAAANFILR
jgi:hypothetical protein